MRETHYLLMQLVADRILDLAESLLVRGLFLFFLIEFSRAAF